MNMKSKTSLLAILAFALAATAQAKETVSADLQTGTNPPTPLKIEAEVKGPFKAPMPSDASTRTTGQGFWRFSAARNLLPIPAEIQSQTKPAHGTIIVDAERDVVYWGLKGVGWVAFSNKLSQSWVVKGDTNFAHGNLHGADLLPRGRKLPLVVAADNEDGEVYLSDTSFQRVEKLGCPQVEQYTKKEEFHPTDAAFISANEIWIGDGYGKAYFMMASVSPFQYTGKIFGGKEFSKTPHGNTYDPREKTLVIAGRSEATIKRWDIRKQKWLESYGLPPGSTVCDTAVWDDYLLAPCLDGESKTPGPIYIVNMKTRRIVSTLRPKMDLGLDEVAHIHDAVWYWSGKGKARELYVLFTNWNPGGVGALKLVNVEMAQR